MSENEPTQMIEGRYRIVRNIAEGGMATVYEAVDERLGRTVAIKVMHTQLAQGPHRDQFVERFRREANSAAAIANPHIVQVYDTCRGTRSSQRSNSVFNCSRLVNPCFSNTSLMKINNKRPVASAS